MVEICFDSQPIKKGTQDPGSVRATLYVFYLGPHECTLQHCKMSVPLILQALVQRKIENVLLGKAVKNARTS